MKDMCRTTFAGQQRDDTTNQTQQRRIIFYWEQPKRHWAQQ